MRDLREAIKGPPRPSSPKIFLPDRFKQSTTELPDGTIVVLDGREDREVNQRPIIEVRPTLPEDAAAQKSLPDEQPRNSGEHQAAHAENSPIEEPPTGTEKSQSKRNKDEKGHSERTGAEKPQKPISRAERRKRIKEEIRKLSQGQGPGYYQRRLWY